MSLTEEQLIERVRRGYEAFNRGDFDAAIELAHPKVVFVRPGGQSELRGTDAVRAWMEPDAFESQISKPREIELVGRKALIHQHTRSRGAGSGIEFEAGSWAVWTLDGEGRITRIETYLEHEEAEARRALRAP